MDATMYLPLNTLIRLPDGRQGRVVYKGLDGTGIRFGQHLADIEAISSSPGNALACLGIEREPPEDFTDYAEALLREPYSTASLECVGTKYEVIEETPACP